MPRAQRLVALEVDNSLIGRLRDRFPNAEIVHANVLDVDLAQWGSATVAGNLPYYITSPIVEKILAMGPLCRRAVLLVQKEVALRITALPGSRDFGYLSVMVQSQAEAKLLFDVPPSAFQPPPKVDSAVVLLTPSRTPPAGFLRFASACFRQKRKTLRNNLLAAYPRIEGQPEASLRAEQLSAADLEALYLRVTA